MESITLDNYKFSITNFNRSLDITATQTISSSGKMRSRKRGSRFSFSITLVDLTEQDREELERISLKDYFIIKYRNEEFFVLVTNESLSFGDEEYLSDGTVIYPAVNIVLSETVPPRTVESL